jgi:hypothetical protein
LKTLAGVERDERHLSGAGRRHLSGSGKTLAGNREKTLVGIRENARREPESGKDRVGVEGRHV